MLNRVVYCGRIATELNVRKSKNNKSFLFFNLAVPRQNDDKTDFINCVVFNNKAENLVKYQSKGNLIIIEGSTETYKKDNINMSRCLVDRITYLENKKEDSIQSVIDSEEDKHENYDIISGEDLPF
ncbi:TPA: single-stranded DNA-binding protein [Staphylococcus aureus]|nr:single-stranded DNA-binding protein [Staphylococcus aureus]HDA2618968.1 single-stranded DNA-binding protein [Staphylococcus aureus]HDC5709741.1 single-stranded DNA-binding protein [Staphylococcus aureus]HDD7172854.1 single-stranded DNA-binding protein [Staphylococcus aureus]HDF8469582.1 single-stranded DNA-binding protein [Staphylococcus aureus]